MIALLSGIKWGLFLAILIGPIMLSLIQAGLEKGVKLGVVLGLGVWLSDLLYIIIVYWSLQNVELSPDFYFYMGIVGGLILISIGVLSLFSKSDPTEKKVIKAKTYGGYFIKGFLINTINPFTVFFWVTMTATEAKGLSFNEVVLFFSGIFGAIILTDFLKVYWAKQLRAKLTPKAMININKIGGIFMIGFGLLLMIRVVVAPPGS